MGEVLPLPNRGEVFLDPRGEGRSLRVSWHRQESMLVLSLWQLGQCRATFRLPTEEVPELVRALVAGLSDSLAQHRDAHQQLSRLVEPPLPGAPPAGPLPPRWDRPPVLQPPTADAPPTTEAAVPAEPSADAVEPAPAEPPAAEPLTEQVEPEEHKPSPAEAVRTHPQVGVPRLIFLAPPDPA